MAAVVLANFIQEHEVETKYWCNLMLLIFNVYLHNEICINSQIIICMVVIKLLLHVSS